mgnify:FL=1|tara:strand:- start:3997 stop:4293 length:297 start_codon:yes stop_codon:yes gene_type:complete
MVIYVDIDGTICESAPTGDYSDALPVQSSINKINKLYHEGNTIIYWTARGTVTYIDWLEMTKDQLNQWGCLFHDVRAGKPQYDLWIDDKSIKIEELDE